MRRAATRRNQLMLTVLTVIAGMLVSMYLFAGGASVIVHTSLPLPEAAATFSQPLNGSQLSPQTNYTIIVSQPNTSSLLTTNTTALIDVNSSLAAVVHITNGVGSVVFRFAAAGVYNLSVSNSTGGQRQSIRVFVGGAGPSTWTPYTVFFWAALPEIFILLAGTGLMFALRGFDIPLAKLPLFFAAILSSILFMTGFSGSTTATINLYWIVLTFLILLDFGIGVSLVFNADEYV